MRRASMQTARTLAVKMVKILGFADDIDIAGRRHTDVVKTFTSLKAEARKMGLEINENKTMYMKTSNGRVPDQEGTTVNIGGHNFGIVDEFVYLGVADESDESMADESMA